MSESKTPPEVRVRIAPSPTGFVHIGNLRTFLYTYLIARKYGGKFIVRIEDTDQARLVEGSVERILDALTWAGIEVDEGVMFDENRQLVEKGELGPYIQSKRLSIYQQYAQELVDKGYAYPCFCSAERLQELRETQQANKQAPMYDKCCQKISVDEAKKRIEQGEKHVIRMKVPEGEMIEFDDLVFGKIKVPSDTVDEQVIIKSDGFPTYHFAVVVDDHLMKISHITRGEDWIPSTPKHVLLYRYFGWEMPVLIHVPNILGQNHKKLSKRQGDVSVDDFIQKGYLPEAMVNFLALLGWNPKTEQELFSMQELIEKFDENAIHKAGAVFDYKKLDWLNSCYIKQKTEEQLLDLARPYLEKYLNEKNFATSREGLLKIVKIEKERIKKLSDISENIDFYFSAPEYEKKLLHWKNMSENEVATSLQLAKKTIGEIDEQNFNLEIIQEKLLAAAGEERGQLLWPLRVALSGKDKSPSPFEIAWIIGKKDVLKRIDFALDKLK